MQPGNGLLGVNDMYIHPGKPDTAELGGTAWLKVFSSYSAIRHGDGRSADGNLHFTLKIQNCSLEDGRSENRFLLWRFKPYMKRQVLLMFQVPIG